MTKDFYSVDVRDNHGDHETIEVQATSQEDAIAEARAEVGKLRMFNNPTAKLLPSCEFNYDFFGLGLTVKGRQDCGGRILISEIKHTASGEVFECPDSLHYRGFGTVERRGVEDDMRIEAMGLMADAS